METKWVEDIRERSLMMIGDVSVVVKNHAVGGTNYYPGVVWRDTKTGTEGWSSYHTLRVHGKWCGKKTGWLPFEQESL